MSRPAKLFLSAVGSLGDLHPALAIAMAARDMGAEVTMGVASNHVDKVMAEGIAAVSIMRGLAQMCEARGVSELEFTRITMQDPGAVLRDLLVPHLGQTVQALGPAADGHDLIAANFLSLAAPIAAEVLRIPMVPLLMQAPRGPAAGANAQGGFMQTMMRNQYGPAINAVRAGVGLGPQVSTPVHDFDGDVPFRLGLFPTAFSGRPEEEPPGLRITGFAVYGSDGSTEELPEKLAAFMDAGDAPLVFTLGSAAPVIGYQFYSDSVAAARMLGKRSVLLTGKGWTGPAGDTDFIACDYAPHAAVFPRAAVNVHQAGIGTLGKAVTSGRPQLMVPVLFDQPGNATQAQAQGLGRMIPFAQYNATSAAAVLRELLTDEAREQARRGAERIGTQDGARIAAKDLIELAQTRRT